MKMRPETMDALTAAAIARSREKIVAALRQSLPDETSKCTAAQLHALCDRGITRAAEYGLDTEHSVYVYVAAMLLYGEDFDTNRRSAWSREILTDNGVDADVKVQAIQLHIAMDKNKRV